MDADKGQALPPPDEVELAVEVFRLLSDTTRVLLLWALRSQELSVGELATLVDKRPTAVSQHLAKLRMARLVQTRREGTTIYYSLVNEHVAQLVTDSVHHAQHLGPGVPEHHRAERLRSVESEGP